MIAPSTAIVDAAFLSELINTNQIVFCGSGAAKWQSVCTHFNAVFINSVDIADSFCQLSYNEFLKGNFANIVAAEPFYCKDFYNPK